MQEIVNLKNVSYIRKEKPILKNINWTIHAGEHWVLLGLNGSGKTTLLNLINGYIFPSEGAVKVLDCEFGKSSIIELRKKIGWVSSSLSEFIPMNDLPLNIVLSGKFASLGLWETVDEEDTSRAEAILKQLNIEKLADRPYRLLSQGEKQKVLIGRALMNNPDIIVFDEAFNGLDIFSRRDLETTISNLSACGITFILVTHNTDEILPVFKNALLLKEGQIHSMGKLEEVITEENLTNFYGEAIDVFRHDERFYLSLKNSNN